MSTTSSVNPGLANLLQTLSNVGSPLLSQPKIVAALQKASPSDIVQLSAEATQLQGLNAILGLSDTGTAGPSASDSILSALYPTTASAAPTDPLLSLEQALAASTAATTSSSSNASTPSLAAALATYQNSLQAAETQALFGIDPSASLTGSSSILG